MSISSCRCCALLSRPVRLRLNHISAPLRSFSASGLVGEVKKLPMRDWGALKPQAPITPPRPAGQSRNGNGGASGRGGLGMGGKGGEEGNRHTPRNNERRGMEGGANRGGRGGFGQRNDRDKGPPSASNFGIKRPGNEQRPELPRRDWSNPRQRDGGNAAGPSRRVAESKATETPVETGTVEAEVEEIVYDDNDQSALAKQSRRRRNVASHQIDDVDGFTFSRGKAPKVDPYARKGKYEQQNEQHALRKERDQLKEQKAAERRQMREKEERQVMIPTNVTVSRLATIFGKKLAHVQSRMRSVGLDEDKQRADYILNADEACDVALEFGFNPTVDDEASFDILPEPEKPGETHPLRPPVVTIMGHVDHGKTTLLDALRNTAVAAGEAGGITQHIGAFSVPLKLIQPSSDSDATITFLDTPGHAAFTAMRARGASVTDIVVCVVAADDGVMPQTKEVLNLVKSEGDGVGLVVAINKVDKPAVDLSRVKGELQAEGIHLEEDGGDVQSVRVSGLARIGLDDLVETLSTLAELRDLRARTDGKAEGYVLESNIDRGIGRVATVLVTRGTLKVGSIVVAGTSQCKVRRMTDHTGKTIKFAGPGTPVVITGWKEIPHAGDELLEAVNGEKEASKAIANRIAMIDRQKLLADTEIINVKRREERAKMEAEQEAEAAVKKAGGNVFEARIAATKRAAAHARETEFKELRLVIKGDVSGTVEAVEGALSGIGNKEAGVKIVHTGVGEVTDSDVGMAEAAEALVIGFNVPASKSVKDSAAQKHVELHLESVIYRLIETVRKKTSALLKPTIESRTLGEGLVSEVFTIRLSRKAQTVVAGTKCGNGTISKNDQVRVIRGPKRDVVYEGKISTLKHLKKEVDEIRKGMDCGISLDGFDDIKEGDEIVTYKTFEVPREL